MTEMAVCWQTRIAKRDPSLRLHLIGIGGAGLSAIAHVLCELGMQVSGSDRQPSAATERLARQGVQISIGQRAETLLALAPDRRPDLVLISSAVDAANPERRAAERLGLPVVKRDQLLPALLAERRLIAVAGTHGKTTTTAMIVQILRSNGIECGYIVGAEVPGYGNGAAGTAAEFVLEADEYDRMFLGLNPAIAVITNVEWDHPDCYPTPASFTEAFVQFAARLQPGGVLVACVDDDGVRQLMAQAPASLRWLTYGLAEEAAVRGVDPQVAAGAAADVRWLGVLQGRLVLAVPGVHNLRNALAATAVALHCQVDGENALQTLRTYSGAARRFEHKGQAGGVVVIDDYAHHPTEVAATLAAARRCYPQQRIWAVFQPHTFSRTRQLLPQLAESFVDADRVLVTDIYAAREEDDGSVHARQLVAACSHPHIDYVGGREQAVARLADAVSPGDVVVTLGAGDSNQIGEWLLATLKDTNRAERGTHAERTV